MKISISFVGLFNLHWFELLKKTFVFLRNILLANFKNKPLHNNEIHMIAQGSKYTCCRCIESTYAASKINPI